MSDGPWRLATNYESASRGSIHHDEQARRRGFEGGLVGGNVHLVLATTALVDRFGPAWYERGFLVFRWIGPVYSGDEVQVRLSEQSPTPLDEALVDVVVVKRDETVVCAGSAGLARSGEPARAPWERSDARPPRALGDYDPLPQPIGFEYESAVLRLDAEAVENVQHGLDPNAWYRGASPWGGPIVPTAAQVVLSPFGAAQAPAAVAEEMRSAMNASLELLQTGPMFQDACYERRATLLAKGTGRYAHRTIEFTLDAGNGRRIARYRQTVKWATARPLR